MPRNNKSNMKQQKKNLGSRGESASVQSKELERCGGGKIKPLRRGWVVGCAQIKRVSPERSGGHQFYQIFILSCFSFKLFSFGL